ncbi:ABC transporter ATP-binding protein [Mesomycoplasma moatsii]|uniref:ABC transporter ATP-binding protein n=1 Tax=Mesomycoplasma moatsii TaxID=171287 RepID=UPI0003B71236
MVSRERIIEIQKLQTHNVNYEGKTFVHGDIEFRNVSFKYFKNSNDYVLKNISFKIPKNSKFGIVGQTGSGKTTLLNLITRMWDISEGEILINGINIKDLKTSSLLENLSYAFQDKKMLFSGTIEDNVKFSNPNIDESRINKAIKIAQLEDFVSSHPQGIKYQLEEFGQNLSGGQKQRINIARAIAREAYIYLFDDVTSALDNLTEKKLLEELNENIQNSSIIMSSQKISSVENMDQIIVLDKGNISSIGTHEELLKKDKIYQEIYNLQNRKEY